MEIDRHEVIAWAEGIFRMDGTEFQPSERNVHLAQAILDADEEFIVSAAIESD